MLNITDIETKEKEKPFCYMTVYLQVKLKGESKPATARIHMDVHAPENITGILEDLPGKIASAYEGMYKDKVEDVEFITEEAYAEMAEDQKSQVRIDFEGDKLAIAAEDLDQQLLYDEIHPSSVANMERLLAGVVSYETEEPDGVENLLAMSFDFDDMLAFGVSKDYLRNFLEDLPEEEQVRYCPDDALRQKILG